MLRAKSRNPPGVNRWASETGSPRQSAPKFKPAALDAQARAALVIGRRYRLRLTVAQIVAGSIIGAAS